MSDGLSDVFKSTTGSATAFGIARCSGCGPDCSKKHGVIEFGKIPLFPDAIDTKIISGYTHTKSMTKAEYLEFHKWACEKMHEITKAKNQDYTGSGDDPFANFTRVESVGICSTEQGFLTRMMDKLCRINSFAQNGELMVKDESVEDTLLDLANYSILMAAYIKSKKGDK